MAKAAKEYRKAIGYLRTSSAANVGADKDSDKRQRAAIEAFATRAGFEIVDWYYDAAVSGADATACGRSSSRPLTVSPAISSCRRPAFACCAIRASNLSRPTALAAS